MVYLILSECIVVPRINISLRVRMGLITESYRALKILCFIYRRNCKHIDFLSAALFSGILRWLKLIWWGFNFKTFSRMVNSSLSYPTDCLDFVSTHQQNTGTLCSLWTSLGMLLTLLIWGTSLNAQLSIPKPTVDLSGSTWL